MKWIITITPQACADKPFCAFATRRARGVIVGINAEGATPTEALQKLRERLNGRA